jgi:hypothetical protein
LVKLRTLSVLPKTLCQRTAPRAENRLAISNTAILLIIWTCAALFEVELSAGAVEEVCVLPLVDTAAGNEAVGVEATPVEDGAAGVKATSVGSDVATVDTASVDAAAAVDSATSLVDAADPEGHQPSEPSES